MKTKTERKSRRFRIQFTVSPALHETYRECVALAAEVQLHINLTPHLERWLTTQLNDVMRKLKRLSDQNSQSGYYTSAYVDATPAASHPETGPLTFKPTPKNSAL